MSRSEEAKEGTMWVDKVRRQLSDFVLARGMCMFRLPGFSTPTAQRCVGAYLM